MDICAEHQAAASKHVIGERTCVCRFSCGFQRVNTKQPQSATTALQGWCVSEFRSHVRTCFGLTGALFAVHCVYLLVISCNTERSWLRTIPGGLEAASAQQRNSHLRVAGLQVSSASSGLALTFLKSTFFLKGSFMDSSLQVVFLKLK